MIKKLFFSIILILIIAIPFSYVAFFHHPESRNTKIIEIKPGSSPIAIAHQLKRDGVLAHNPMALRIAVKVTKTQKKLRSGFFEFHVPSSPMEIINVLTKGKMVLQRVVVPEGSNMKEIALALERAEIITGDAFMSAATDAQWIQSLGIEAQTIEGYLFPETYFFAKDSDAYSIVQTMVDHFFDQIQTQDLQKAQHLGLNLHQWITLASIIEKEAGHPGEYPLIASVFHNRLKKKMRLQSDPTIIYGMENYDGNIRRKDIHTPTPYNTYTIPALPPGPIASPGRGALQATINPPQTEYLFFVSNNLKEHIFSKTYEEHKKHVETYQIKGKNRK